MRYFWDWTGQEGASILRAEMVVRVIYRRNPSAGFGCPKPRRSWITLAILGAIALTCVGDQHSEELRAVAATVSAANGLELRLERSGRDFRLSWNPESDFIVAAASGKLTIREGNVTRTLALTHDQLCDGRIFYLDDADPGTFRLRLFETNGSIAEALINMDSVARRTSAAVP